MKVGSIIGESIDVHRVARGREKKERVVDLLERVGLSAKHFDRYPHEFSGGQRQRIGVARALAITPKIIVCDEPVSALDVSIQAQVINLLQDVQEDFGLTYIFISHNLNVVKHISDRVVVMYLGQIVELTSRDELYSNPLHPYSKALLSAVPIADPDINKEEIVLTGDVPSPVNPPPGCRFHPRCFAKGDICSRDEPELKTLRSGHAVACHYSKDDDCKR